MFLRKHPRVKHLIRYPLRSCLPALLLALGYMLLSPLTTLACGGMFSADTYTEQSAERLIFAVDPGKITLYEQIHYTGSPKNFAWVLPVPSVPTVGTAPTSMFQALDEETAPVISIPSSSECGPFFGAGSAAPSSSSSYVQTYRSGAVGPYSYDIVGSSNPQAIIQWLTGHRYQIPGESRAEIKLYTDAHMLFLAMRLRGNAGTQDMQPVKISYPTSSSDITIPLRMATPMGKENLRALVWIYAQHRYVPQNYRSVQVDYSQITSDAASPSYQTLVSQAVSNVQGHGFITEFAVPTQNMYNGTPELTALALSHSYLTRMNTSIAPAQITLDPTFAPASGLADVSRYHSGGEAMNSPSFCITPGVLVLGCLGGILVAAPCAIIFFVVRRRRRAQVS